VIVVSPLIHKMLHFAAVSSIDLRKIKDNKLVIKINERDYTITWHPNHTAIIERSMRGS